MRAFIVTVTSETARADASLSDITGDYETVAEFNAATLTYNVEITFGTTATPVVIATTTNANANAVVTDATYVTSTTEADRTTTIVVTAEDESTVITYTIVFSVAQETGDLYFSEYVEGSSNNRDIEIYNSNERAVDLRQYVFQQSNNGTGWGVDGEVVM